MWRNLIRDERGATAIEYGLIATLIAVALAGTFLSVGNNVNETYETIEGEYTAAND